MPSNSNNSVKPQNSRSKKSRKSAAQTSSLTQAQKAEISRIVSRQVARTEEVKVANYTTGNACGSYNYTGFASNQIQMLSPYQTRLNIGQGTGQADRVGNTIHVKRGHCRLLFTVAPYDVTTNPLPQPVFILYYIFSKKLSSVEGSSLANFFETGNSSASPTGTAQDLLYDVDTDVYTVFKKGMVKLGYSAFVGTPGGVVGSGYFSNNDSDLSAVIDIDYTNFLKKKIDFLDTTNNSTGDTVEIAFWTINQNGSATSTAVYQTNFWINNSLYYTDA